MDDPESMDDKLDHQNGALQIYGVNDCLENHLGSDRCHRQREIEPAFARNRSEYRSQSFEMESDSYPLSNSQSLSLSVNLKERDIRALPQLDLSNHLNGLRLLALATAENPRLMEHVVAVATCLPLSTNPIDQLNKSEFLVRECSTNFLARQLSTFPLVITSGVMCQTTSDR